MPSEKRNPRALIRYATGKKAGQFRFILVGTNGEVVGTSGSETYPQKHSARKTLKKYFPNFTIVDLTHPIWRKPSDKKIALDYNPV